MSRWLTSDGKKNMKILVVCSGVRLLTNAARLSALRQDKDHQSVLDGAMRSQDIQRASQCRRKPEMWSAGSILRAAPAGNRVPLLSASGRTSRGGAINLASTVGGA
jgi:hypothetical protein